MISISENRFLTLAQAAKLIPGRPSIPTVARWIYRGYKGVRLESWRSGRKRVTSVEAINRFLKEINGDSAAQVESHNVHHHAAEVALDVMGV